MGKNNNSNLEGKLKDVVLGDRIRIWNNEEHYSDYCYEASGYVTHLDKSSVTLSIEHPLRKPKDTTIAIPFTLIPLGNPKKEKTYLLTYFSHYAHQVDKTTE